MMVDAAPSQPLEDPAQSWNALTIGGFTHEGTGPAPPPVLEPVVPANHRSPFSRGSQSLADDLTPIKPEVLFEAGNMLSDATGFCGWHPAVSLLAPGSTWDEPLVPFWATSAAVGVAGNFVGSCRQPFPICWPETHRALTVDSARLAQPMRKAADRTWRALEDADRRPRNSRFFARSATVYQISSGRSCRPGTMSPLSQRPKSSRSRSAQMAAPASSTRCTSTICLGQGRRWSDSRMRLSR